jgi:hypothetical protein
VTESSEGQGPAPEPVDHTKHSSSIRSRDGRMVTLTRDDTSGMVALSINVNGGGVGLTAWLEPLALLRLLAGDKPNCRSCRFSRTFDGRELRCHRNGPRHKAGQDYFPRVPTPEWCGHYRPMVAAPVAAVAS